MGAIWRAALARLRFVSGRSRSRRYLGTIGDVSLTPRVTGVSLAQLFVYVAYALAAADKVRRDRRIG